MNTNIEVYGNDMEILRKTQKTIKNKIYTVQDNEIKVGDLYMLDSLFFVISDTEEYPYEVLICSNFWELATDEDIIVKSANGDTWAIENIIRYVDDRIIEQSFKIDKIDEKYINIMKKYVYEGKNLPKNIKGLKASQGSFQEKFKKHELKRSLILTVGSIFGEEEEEPAQKITINIMNTPMERSIMQDIESKMVAASFDKFIKTNLGEIMLKNNDTITIKFDDEYIGLPARLFISKQEVFSGILPKRINIKTTINLLEILKENLEIEFL